MNEITSINNQKVKDWKKLHTRKNREKYKSYLIEGYHLIEEAINHDYGRMISLIVREDIFEKENIQYLLKKIDKNKIIVITKNIASEISTTQTNQGIFAELHVKETELPNKINQPILCLDAVQDPGNVGTMIRTAAAAGFQGVFLGKGSVDLYNDKTLRSAQGSHFQMDIYEGNLETFILDLKEKEIPVFATILDKEAQSYKNVQTEIPFALVVGNEGAGIRKEIIHLVDEKIYIPMKGPVESLNVAIASSIIMFHLN